MIVFSILSLFTLFLSVNFVSALSCQVVLRDQCNTPGEDYIVMGLSSFSDAHGQNATGSPVQYDYVLCCDFSGTTTCSSQPHPVYGGSIPKNKIVGLSTLSNAHAEVPGLDNYPIDICYGYLECTNRADSCDATYPLPILSLSASTDAHLSNFSGVGSYATKICCKDNSPFIGPQCDLTDATWQFPQTSAGLDIHMNVTGTNCVEQGMGADINFSIYKDNAIGPDTYITSISGNYPTGIWEAQEGSNYYFIAKAKRSSDEFSSLDGTGNDKLTVTAGTDNCDSINVCEDYTDSEGSHPDIECDTDSCNVAFGDPRIDPNPPIGYSYGCQWDGVTDVCKFVENYGGNSTVLCKNGQTLCYNPNSGSKYCYPAYACPSGHATLADGDGLCEAGEGCSNPECLINDQDSCVAGTKCKKGTNENEGICYSTGAVQNETSCTSGYTLCITGGSKYCFGGGVCPSGSTPAAGSCASASPNPSVTCIGTNATCKDGACYDSTIAVGKCTYNYISTGDTCADGFLSYSWTTTWTGTGTKPANCADGSVVRECPAQIPLPLFTPVNAVITVLVIIGIYVIIAVVKSKKRHTIHRRNR